MMVGYRVDKPARANTSTSIGFKNAFIAAPMSAFDTDAAYRESRNDVLSLVAYLKGEYSFSRVYYAGEGIASQTEFNDETLALKADIGALKESDIFILYYPSKVASSVLVEAGFAFSREIPMLLLVKDEKDLPYLFREANGIPAEKGWMPSLCICEFSSSEDLLTQLDLGMRNLARLSFK